jgi:hypothetical protein
LIEFTQRIKIYFFTILKWINSDVITKFLIEVLEVKRKSKPRRISSLIKNLSLKNINNLNKTKLMFGGIILWVKMFISKVLILSDSLAQTLWLNTNDLLIRHKLTIWTRIKYWLKLYQDCQPRLLPKIRFDNLNCKKKF